MAKVIKTAGDEGWEKMEPNVKVYIGKMKEWTKENEDDFHLGHVYYRNDDWDGKGERGFFKSYSSGERVSVNKDGEKCYSYTHNQREITTKKASEELAISAEMLKNIEEISIDRAGISIRSKTDEQSVIDYLAKYADDYNYWEYKKRNGITARLKRMFKKG